MPNATIVALYWESRASTVLEAADLILHALEAISEAGISTFYNGTSGASGS
jgi:phosphoribosyl-ATP pyrophosphohydrolase